jgi:Domain of unknown function (DUF4438), N-terminal/Domain of unknown function (DUF4438), C-terminal
MKKKVLSLFVILAFAAAAGSSLAAGQANKQTTKPQPITTNKDRLLIHAVQGQIAPAQVIRGYSTTWDGKAKLAIGNGGINYSLNIGDKVFGWAAADKATVGVAAEATTEDKYNSAWLTHSSIGNEARVLSGKAAGEKGVVIGTSGIYILIHFDAPVLDELAIGDTIQVKACGVGLEINGFNDVFVHHLAPEVLDKLEVKNVGGKLEVPVVKEIPAEIMGQGPGGPSLSGNWHIQTCFPPDIKKYGLDGLRYGDLVLLKDVQTDYWKGYFRGGATVGVINNGPSDMSGQGIGVTPILSTRFGKITGRIDPAANIGKYLGLGSERRGPTSDPAAGPLKTNKDMLLTTAVQGVVQPASGGQYEITYDGKPIQDVGMASINYNVSLGDTTYGWANGDHVEPDVTIQGRDKPSPSDCALAILACIGNEAEVLTGDAKGAKGIYIGRHAGSDDKVWFPGEIKEKLALNDKIQVKARGVGLKIEGFEDVRVNKLSPEVLEKMGITVEGGELVVPVVMEVPAYIMGSGLGSSFIESLDYDIQTTCPQIVDELGLKKLRLGDVVAIKDAYDFNGSGRYQGAVTIGTVIHGFSNFGGHGPGLNVVLSALPGRIKTRIDPNANTAYYLGIKTR